jgi:alcohol dehydrogenase class IV
MRGEWRFFSAGQIIFGRGVVRRTGEAVRRLGSDRVLLVTDPALVAAGLDKSVTASLDEAGIAWKLFDGGLAKPTVDAVAACVDAAKSGAYDAVVALGGGSNIDLAKAAAVVLKYGGTADEYFGLEKVPGPILPLVAVSTTAGTGSEVSAASVIADPANNRRGSFLSNWIRPQVAIYDPLLTVSCPPQVTADAGIDALTHAIEAYMVIDHATEAGSVEPGPYQGRFLLYDLVAEQAHELVGRYLRRAVYQGGDIEAREGMHQASLLAGLSFSNAGLNAVHALEYPVGVRAGTTHGAGNGLLLPFVMDYNAPACPDRLAAVAELLGEEVDGLSDREAAQATVEAVQQLKADIGIPMRLRDVGIKREELPSLAEATSAITRLLDLNPRPLDQASLQGILENAW